METGETKSPAKESTILSLTEEMAKHLYDLQDRLDNRFDRSGKDCEAKCEASVIPNVLDEIIKRQESNIAYLSRMKSFISSEVLPKIS